MILGRLEQVIGLSAIQAEDLVRPSASCRHAQAALRGAIRPGGVTMAGHVSLDMPATNAVRHRTRVSIPNGGAVLLTGAVPGGDGQEEVVVLLRARVRAAVK